MKIAKFVAIGAVVCIAACGGGGGGGGGGSQPSMPLRFLYASAYTEDAAGVLSSAIYAYSVDSAGALTAVVGSPFAPTMNGYPIPIAISHASKFLYSVD